MIVYSVILIFGLSLLSFTNGKHIHLERDENDRFEQIIAGGIILNENIKEDNSEESILIFAADKEPKVDAEPESQDKVDITVGLLMFATGNNMDIPSDTEEEAMSHGSSTKQNLQAIERLFNNKDAKKRRHGQKSHTHGH